MAREQQRTISHTLDGTDLASDPELKRTQENTVNIFIQYVSQTIPVPVETQCTARPVANTSTAAVKSKSRETHPKAVHSTSLNRRTNDATVTWSAAQVEEATCSGTQVAASTTYERDYEIISQAEVQSSCNTSNSYTASASLGCSNRNQDESTAAASGGDSATTRPRTLFLDVKRPNLKRGVSNTSSSSGKITPAQDPPLLSPGSDLVQSYPPTACAGQWLHNGAQREGSVVEVLPRHHGAHVQLNTSPVQCQADPQTVLAKKIADRLRTIGDQINNEQNSEKLEGLVDLLQQLSTQSLTSSLFSWSRVQEIFSLLSHLLKQLIMISPSGVAPDGDETWNNFTKLWDLLIFQVTPWIRQIGGWNAFLRSTDFHSLSPRASRHPGRPTGDRHSSYLPEVSSTPLLPQCQPRTLHCSSRPTEKWTHTPKLSRARQPGVHPSASAATTVRPLSRSSTLPAIPHRHRVWSWSESGQMVDQEGGGGGVGDDDGGDTDSLSASDSYAVFEDDSPVTEGGDENDVGTDGVDHEMVFATDEAEHSFEPGHQITSSPYLVRSLHHPRTQMESYSDCRLDSGIHSSIETLSLSLSPPHHTVNFGIGDSSLTRRHNVATSSYTSLGSFSSLDQGSIDSSRKNSITSQPGRRSSTAKPHPLTGGGGAPVKAGQSKGTGTTAESPDDRGRANRPRPQSAGAGSHSGSEYLYTMGVGVSAAFIFNRVSTYLRQ